MTINLHEMSAAIPERILIQNIVNFFVNRDVTLMSWFMKHSIHLKA